MKCHRVAKILALIGGQKYIMVKMRSLSYSLQSVASINFY